MNLGKMIKLVRVLKDIDQSGLAKAVGVSTAFVSLIETGKREPSITTAKRIAEALQIPIGLLFVASDNPPIETKILSDIVDIITEYSRVEIAKIREAEIARRLEAKHD